MDKERELKRADRRWAIAAASVVGGFLAFSMFVAFIALPVAQAPNAGIDPWTAICRAIGILPGTPAQPQPRSSAAAAPVSQVSWAPDTLRVLDQGDIRLGASIAAATCTICHGDRGVSLTPQFPHLAGQSAAALYKQLADYKSGARVHPLMTPVVQQLTVQQMAQVSRYYAAVSAYGALGERAELPDPTTADLVNRGDQRRRIPSCNSCHAPNSGGPIETPTLSGQRQQYLSAQLRAYRSGQRRNDVYRRMRDIAIRLSDEEVDRLAAYYEGLR